MLFLIAIKYIETNYQQLNNQDKGSDICIRSVAASCYAVERALLCWCAELLQAVSERDLRSSHWLHFIFHACCVSIDVCTITHMPYALLHIHVKRILSTQLKCGLCFYCNLLSTKSRRVHWLLEKNWILLWKKRFNVCKKERCALRSRFQTSSCIAVLLCIKYLIVL